MQTLALLALLPTAAAQDAAPSPPDAPEATPEAAPLPETGSLLLTGARILDGTGAPPREGAAILVVGGRIAAIADGPEGLLAEQTVALDGATVIPGLIDSHTHITLAPGQHLPEAGVAEAREAILRAQLRSHVAAGVTTVLDAAAYDHELDEVRGWLDDGAPGPRVLALGTPAVMSGSYGAAILPEIGVQDTPEAVRAHVATQAQRDVVGLKLLVEDGLMGPIWPLPEGAWLDALVGAAAENDLPLFAHAMTPEETAHALQASPRAMIHGMDAVDDEVIAALVEAGTYVVPTAFVTDAPLAAYYPERLEDPLLTSLVPAELLANAADPELRVTSNLAIGATVAPRLPKWLVKRMGGSAKFAERLLGERLDAVSAMYEAGVPLVLGSDAPGWPIMLDGFHGYGTIRELELLEMAGLPPEELLIAATSRPAEMLGVEDEIGRVAEGYAADLVVLDADPLEGAAAYREVRYVIRAGELRSPEGWLSE